MPKIKTFEDLERGDILEGVNGEPVEVTWVHPRHTPDRMFELVLEDGRTVQAGGTHLWYVITDEDWSMMSQRRATLRSGFRRLSKAMQGLLQELAISEEHLESSFSDFLTMLLVDYDSDFGRGIERVFESLGPIVEENYELRDLMTDEIVDARTVPVYDATLAAQQILSFAKKDKWHRRVEPLAGSVITSEQLVELASYNDVEIPALNC
mgnify:CR=1 FL=1